MINTKNTAASRTAQTKCQRRREERENKTTKRSTCAKHKGNTITHSRLLFAVSVSCTRTKLNLTVQDSGAPNAPSSRCTLLSRSFKSQRWTPTVQKELTLSQMHPADFRPQDTSAYELEASKFLILGVRLFVTRLLHVCACDTVT